VGDDLYRSDRQHEAGADRRNPRDAVADAEHQIGSENHTRFWTMSHLRFRLNLAFLCKGNPLGRSMQSPLPAGVGDNHSQSDVTGRLPHVNSIIRKFGEHHFLNADEKPNMTCV